MWKAVSSLLLSVQVRSICVADTGVVERLDGALGGGHVCVVALAVFE